MVQNLYGMIDEHIHMISAVEGVKISKPETAEAAMNEILKTNSSALGKLGDEARFAEGQMATQTIVVNALYGTQLIEAISWLPPIDNPNLAKKTTVPLLETDTYRARTEELRKNIAKVN